jgi:alpha-glucuronidase
LQPFMKGKGSAASNVECVVDSNRTTRHLDAIAVAAGLGSGAMSWTGSMTYASPHGIIQGMT